MSTRRQDLRRRVFVPGDLTSFLRAPYGWTSRMRRVEGYPARGERHPIRMGARAQVAAALVTCGPAVVGALAGWQRVGGWSGAGIGALVGVVVQAVILVAALPVVMFVSSRRGSR